MKPAISSSIHIIFDFEKTDFCFQKKSNAPITNSDAKSLEPLEPKNYGTWVNVTC